jgi:uncharacterized glyoxalase superfamily protein PhnB
MAVEPVPAGYHRVNIHLTFKDTKKAIEFYKQAFGFEPGIILPGPGGHGIVHAEIRLGDTTIFMADDMMCGGKTVDNGDASAFVPHLAVTDANASWKRAMDAGCKEVLALKDQFWGDRYGQIVDPFGLRWAILQHIEDVSQEEMARRAAKEFGGA